MSESAADPKLEAGAYEVIRQRLDKQGEALRNQLEALNADRKAVFGGIETALLTTTRLTTENNCLPRDLAAIGPRRFIFGYNVQLGLRSEMKIDDTFAVYDFDPNDHTFHVNTDVLHSDPAFAEDFAYLYRYYKNATFLKFHRLGPHFYMGMQVGRDVSEIKVFKWLINEEDGSLRYLGNRFDHEFVFPTAQEFEWKRARRDMYRFGEHPHISIEDRVFVETIGGDLTIKVEDNTTTGSGIYREPVENKDQTLDDAEVHYAFVGNLILLKILPYLEKNWRHIIYNERTQEARRVDSIAESCVMLPDDHGVIFPHGYMLQTGGARFFDTGLPPMRFERRLTAANGEDTLFIFHHLETGLYLLLAYNLITQDVATPIICNGFSLFPSGELVVFSSDAEPRKHHVVQIWRTPFTSEEQSSSAAAPSLLTKIGNAEIVRCMAECNGVLTLLGKDDSFSGLYVELVRATSDIVDSYFWVDKPEAHDLKETLQQIKQAAEAALGEFEKVRRLRKAATEQTAALREQAGKTINAALHTEPSDILGFVHLLTSLRDQRGQLIALRDVRYVDLEEVSALEQRVIEATDTLSEKCIAFLLRSEALDPYRQEIEKQKDLVPDLQKVTDGEEVETALAKASAELEMLVAIVSGLKIKDATETTRIVENISTLFAQLNQVRSVLRNRRTELARVEGSAQFQAQLSLLSQSVLNYLEICDTPEKCDDSLTRALVQLEELESRFADFDEFAAELAVKREEVQAAFEARRLSLVEARNRRAQNLGQSAERILSSVRNRLASFSKPEEVHSWLASDAMVAKLRDLIEELLALGDNVHADDLTTKLKTLQQDSLKQIRDKADLFAEGGDVIQLGRHQFSVNRQPLELTILPREGGLSFHLTGTRYFEPIAPAELDELRPVWEQSVVSENALVYRGEYLAWQILKQLESSGETAVTEFLDTTEDARLAHVRDFMHLRYHEGYTKGVHDHDATRIITPLLHMHRSLGLLRHAPTARGLALWFWHAWPESDKKLEFAARMQAAGTLKLHAGAVDNTSETAALATRMLAAWKGQPDLRGFYGSDQARNSESSNIFQPESWCHAAAACLIDELQSPAAKSDLLPITRSNAAITLVQTFRKALSAQRATAAFSECLDSLTNQPFAQLEITLEWLSTLFPNVEMGVKLEAAALLILRDQPPVALPLEPPFTVPITDLTGAHPRIEQGNLTLDYHEFTNRLHSFESISVPAFERFQALKHELIQQRRAQLRLDQFKAGVLSSFVRNRLIDNVYLPLIGANLAKQIGTVGGDTRTDRMGLLLLISPPGYGKTTLMEYVANRLGITLVKVNGPALGHQVTSLDPAEAPNASAREEIEKLNLAFEMGDNVMIYVDDIQHTNPEFLQKFISLCDGTRKIEGVFRGQARTYDLRGRKVAVVMAGNPYTEVGGKFQIPDMLANRADTYNLGDILSGHEAAFKDSYIENALTSNPVLARLSARSHADALACLKIAQTGHREGIEFEAAHSSEDINDAVAVMEKLLAVREVMLRVNQEYIRSAAMDDAYRVEPPFKLQGSYRNMNKIAEKIVPLMTDAEVATLIADHYRGEAQTLTSAAETNLLKWRELNQLATSEDTARWNEIKRTFARNLLTGGAGETDPVTRITGHLQAFTTGLERIQETLARFNQGASLSETTVEKLQQIIADLRAVPVEVEIKVQPVEQATPGALPIDIQNQVRQGDA